MGGTAAVIAAASAAPEGDTAPMAAGLDNSALTNCLRSCNQVIRHWDECLCRAAVLYDEEECMGAFVSGSRTPMQDCCAAQEHYKDITCPGPPAPATVRKHVYQLAVGAWSGRHSGRPLLSACVASRRGGSVDRRACGLHHLAQPRVLFGAEVRQRLAGRGRRNRAAGLQGLAHFRTLQRLVHCGVQLVQDGNRGALGRVQPIPGEELVALDARLADRGDVRVGTHPFRRGHAERPQLARGNLARHIGHHINQERNASAQEVSHGCAAALVRNVHDTDAGHLVQEFTGQVRRGAVAGRPTGQFARMGFGVVEQLRQRLETVVGAVDYQRGGDDANG
ncbi:hypothetical protein G6F31_014672 [Rhizopus arrhizus]|nr:hypothetical protein G6F31_014672 [Rhizopus arrhizus]